MRYYLATTENVMRFYVIDVTKQQTFDEVELIPVWDLNRLHGFATKQDVQDAAKRIGLKSFRYAMLHG